MIQVFLIGLGLSADAFAVSITNGLSLKNISRGEAVKIAAAFGIFQGVMPLLGFLLGTVFAEFINSVAHYVALIFLGFIGVKMLLDEFKNKNNKKTENKAENKENFPEKLPFKSLIIQAIATSIDALVAGVVLISMGITGFEVIPCVVLIGLTTFIISFFGVALGKRFGKLLGGRAKIAGGIILIGLGLKIFLENVLY